jgi:uncharacterized protein (TIRG00374 family)
MALRDNLWQFIVLSLAVVLALSIYADFDRLLQAFRMFQWWLVPLILGLTLINQFVRFLKWEYLLREVGVHLPLMTSAYIFGSGLIMIMTPGKIGEVWKSWLVRDVDGTPVSTTMPVVVAERITDLLGVVAISLLGVLAFDYSPLVLVALTIPLLLGIAILQYESVCLWLLKWIDRMPFFQRYAEDVRNLYQQSQGVLSLRPLTVTTSLSIVSWGMECLGLWIVLRGFGADVSVLVAAFVFAFSSILGAVSLLPGGLGVTGGSMTGLLLVFNVERVTAVSATLVIRAATLWFSAGLALLVYAQFRRIRSITVDERDELG